MIKELTDEIDEYKNLLKSGMFWEFYPSLSGEWEKDKDEWNNIYKKLKEQRLAINENL